MTLEKQLGSILKKLKNTVANIIEIENTVNSRAESVNATNEDVKAKAEEMKKYVDTMNSSINTLNTLETQISDLKTSVSSTTDRAEKMLKETQAIRDTLTDALVWKGSVENYAALPTTNVRVGDTYNVTAADSAHNINAGDNVVWDGTKWDAMGGIMNVDSLAIKGHDANFKDVTATTFHGALNGKADSATTADVAKTVAWNNIGGKPATFPSGIQFDNVPTEGSANAVKSSGIKTALDAVNQKASIQADWSSTDSSSISFIKNIPNSIKSINNSSNFRIKKFYKVDNHGYPTYRIIQELTNYHPTNRPSNWRTYGFSVIALCDIRGGNSQRLEPAFMYASLGYEYNMLKSTSSVDFPVVLHNIESNKYYVAIQTSGSYKNVTLIGDFCYPDIELGEEILAQDDNGTPPSGWELTYKPTNMLSMGQLQAGRADDALKLTYERLIKLTGDMTGDIYFDGSKNITVNTTVNESKHAADVTDATVSPEKSNHGGVTVPASGVIENLNTVTGSNDLTSTNKLRSYIGSVYNGDWYNVISIRHRNGVTDGINFGLLMYSNLTDANDTIHYKKQNQDWTAERTLLDSSNYNSYAPTKTGTGASGTWSISITGNASTATKLVTPRTLALTGKVAGSATFDGSTNTSINVTSVNADSATNDGNGANIANTYLKKSGGTMTGALNFANGAKNIVGDDVAIGDFNRGGTLGVQGENGDSSIMLIKNGAAWSANSEGAIMTYNSSTQSLDFNFQ